MIAALIGFLSMVSLPLSDLYEVYHVRVFLFGAIVVLFGFQVLYKGRLQFRDPTLMCYLLVAIWLVIGLVYTRAVHYGSSKIVLFFSYYWLLGIVIYNSLATLRDVRRMVLGLALGGGALLAICFKEFGDPVALFGSVNRFFRLHLGESGNPIFLSRYLGTGLIFILGYTFVLNKKINLFWVLPVACAIIAYMLLTGSKGPLIALFLSMALTGTVFSGRPVLTLIAVSFVALSVAAAGYFLLPEEFVQQRFISKVENFSNRLPVYQQTLDAILGADLTAFAIGHGTGDFGFFMGHADERAYPHNIFLELGYENGIIGIVLMLITLGMPVFQVWRRFRSVGERDARLYLSFMLCAYIFSIISAQSSGDLGANTFIGIFGASLVGSVRERVNISAKPVSPSRKRGGIGQVSQTDNSMTGRRVLA